MTDSADRRALRVVLLDDDPATQDLTRAELGGAGMEVLVADTPAAFKRLHVRGRTDLILMEPALHGPDGWALLREIRSAGDETPVLMISSHAADVDRIVGLELGADDFVAKPFHPRELLARIRAVLRRRPAPDVPGAPSRSAELIHFGPFAFDLQRRELRKGEHPLPLTTGEYAMLKALVRHPGQPLTRDQLAMMARGRTFGPFDRSLDVQISRLRRVVEDDPAHPRFIQTVWGVGYVFVPG